MIGNTLGRAARAPFQEIQAGGTGLGFRLPPVGTRPTRQGIGEGGPWLHEASPIWLAMNPGRGVH